MQAPGIPENEEQRLKSLYITGLLDTRDDERFERLPGRRRARNPA